MKVQNSETEMVSDRVSPTDMVMSWLQPVITGCPQDMTMSVGHTLSDTISVEPAGPMADDAARPQVPRLCGLGARDTVGARGQRGRRADGVGAAPHPHVGTEPPDSLPCRQAGVRAPEPAAPAQRVAGERVKGERREK